MAVPGRLQARTQAAALPQSEPEPVLNGLEVRRAPDPALARGMAGHGIDSARRLAFLVAGDCRLALIRGHASSSSNNVRVILIDIFARVNLEMRSMHA